MPSSKLKRGIADLEEQLRSGKPIGPSHDVPFALFVYDPKEEVDLRREVALLATRVSNAGRPVKIVDLGQLMWECFEDHPLGGIESLFKAEKENHDLQTVLGEARRLLIGSEKGSEPGPLERRVLDRMEGMDPREEVAFLVRASELFPVYRTSALLERLIGQPGLPTAILFYPGKVRGTTQPSFMGVNEPSPRYRVTIMDYS